MTTASNHAENPATTARLSHYPALDGLRGLALLLVLLFHSEGWLQGGFLGVDLFFVLSGFLITRLLLHELETTGKVNWLAFWGRRFRRLAPALLALFPALALYARYIMDDAGRISFRGDALATLFYVANWRAIWIQRDYWELFAAPSPLEHSWSLSIEEQFYLLWPVIFAACAAVCRRQRAANFAQNNTSLPLLARFRQLPLATLLTIVSVVLALASVLSMALRFDPRHISRVYLGSDTRAGAILIGATLACLAPYLAAKFPPNKHKALLQSLCFTGLGVTLLGSWFIDGQTPALYRGGFFAFELLSALMIAGIALQPDGAFSRVLQVPPLRYLGAVSYGAYLWHWPAFCLLTPERTQAFFGAETALPAVAFHAVRFALTFLLAHASYRYLEMPIRRGAFKSRGPLWLGASALSAAALALLVTRGAYSAQNSNKNALNLPPFKQLIGARIGIFDVSFQELPPADRLPQGTTRLLVLGDSVANKLGTAMRHRQDEFPSFIAERGVGNCSILKTATGLGSADGPRNCAAAWLEDVKQLRPDATLLVLGGGFLNRLPQGDEMVGSCRAEFQSVYLARLRELVAEIRPFSAVVALVRVPYPVGRWRKKETLSDVDCFNALLHQVAEMEQLAEVDLMAHVCPTPECRLLDAGAPIRPDGLHFDGAGAENSARFTIRGTLSALGRARDLHVAEKPAEHSAQAHQ